MVCSQSYTVRKWRVNVDYSAERTFSLRQYMVDAPGTACLRYTFFVCATNDVEMVKCDARRKHIKIFSASTFHLYGRAHDQWFGSLFFLLLCEKNGKDGKREKLRCWNDKIELCENITNAFGAAVFLFRLDVWTSINRIYKFNLSVRQKERIKKRKM